MKVLFKLALNNLKKNRTQTFITLIGIILSVILITSIFTLFNSFYSTLKNNLIDSEGSWNYLYADIDASQKAVIDAKPYIKVTYPMVYFSEGKASDDRVGSYELQLIKTDMNGFKYAPIHLIKGRTPNSPNELLVSDILIKLYPEIYQIGKEVRIDLGTVSGSNYEITINESKVYTITGSYKGEQSGVPSYSVYTYSDVASMNPNDKIILYVVEKQISTDMIERVKDFAYSFTDEPIGLRFHESLLAYSGVNAGDYGQAITMFTILIFFLVLIVIGGASALIYGGFSMTATDLMRQLGLLSSVGATKSQKRLIILIQAAILSVFGIIIGIFLGAGLIFVLLNFVNTQTPNIVVSGGIKFHFNTFILSVSILISLITIFISALVPAIKVSKKSAIDLIRQNQQIRLSKSSKKLPFYLKPFGVEVGLSYKNIKRFNRRHRSTRLSIVLSIVLFLVVIGYSTLIKQSTAIYTPARNYDMSVGLHTEQESIRSSFYSKIAKLDEIKDYSLIKEYWCFVDSNLFIDPPIGFDSKTENISVVIMDDMALSKYLTKLGLSQDLLNRNSIYNSILINKGITYDLIDQISYEKTYLNVKENDIIDVSYKTGETNQTGNEFVRVSNKLTVVKITDQYPLGLDNISETPVLIISQKTSQLMFNKIITNTTMFITTDNAGMVESAIRSLYDEKPIGQLFINNFSAFHDEGLRNLQTMFLFLYSFVGIIAAISVMNILNSVYTTIMNRRRELTMLKSIGMTQKSLRRMLGFESLFYGFGSILISFPLGFIIVYGIYIIMNSNRYVRFDFDFPYLVLIPTGLVVVLIVYLTMLLTLKRLEKDNIIDQLKDETI
jgi:putative ABC transport system permease protein